MKLKGGFEYSRNWKRNMIKIEIFKTYFYRKLLLDKAVMNITVKKVKDPYDILWVHENLE